MKRLALIVLMLGVFVFSGCDILAPDISKAQTENKQLEELKEQTKIELRQAEALERIAVILEKMAEKQGM